MQQEQLVASVCMCVCELACICVGGEWRKMEQESCTMTKLLHNYYNNNIVQLTTVTPPDHLNF